MGLPSEHRAALRSCKAGGHGSTLGGTTVKIVGTGLGGTYSVSFGPNPAASFAVNKAGTRITAVTPSSTMTGPVQITVTTLGGTATTIFSYS